LKNRVEGKQTRLTSFHTPTFKENIMAQSTFEANIEQFTEADIESLEFATEAGGVTTRPKPIRGKD
jgi:hypothetical protein